MTGSLLPEQEALPAISRTRLAERKSPQTASGQFANLFRIQRSRILAGTIAGAIATFSLAHTTETAHADTPVSPIRAPVSINSPPAASADTNKSESVSGAELTSEHGFYLTLLSAGDSFTIVRDNGKTFFGGVKRNGEKNIRICGYLSKWESKKYDVDVLPKNDSNPCTTDEMNQLKNRYTFGEDFNGKHKVDGTFGTPLDLHDTHCTDTRLFRYYGPSEESPINLDPTVQKGFDLPLTLDDGTPAHLSNKVHYRFEEKIDGKAANIRIDPEDIVGLTADEKKKMNKWFWVDRDCLPDTIVMNGPEKDDNAKRGKNPNSTTVAYLSGTVNYKTMKTTTLRGTNERKSRDRVIVSI